VRHAEAPGVGDPPGWSLDDCATQRNLSAQGRSQARELGTRLRQERVAIGRVLSSPWCRCLDTARLLEVGTVVVEPAFANVFMLPERRTASAEQARALIGRWRGPGTLLVVTHAENIRDLTGQGPRSGEMVVVAPGEGGALRVIGSVLPATRRP
jgi:broad specificity phosphatase PhoE